MYLLSIQTKLTNIDKFQFDYDSYLKKVYNTDKSIASSNTIMDGVELYRPFLPDTKVVNLTRDKNGGSESWGWIEKDVDSKGGTFTLSSFHIIHIILKVSEMEYRYMMNMYFPRAIDYRIYKYYYKPKLKFRSWKLSQKKKI